MKIAVVTPSNGRYINNFKNHNFKIHEFRRWVYELLNKVGHCCDYIGIDDLNIDKIIKYDVIFLLNHLCHNSAQNKAILSFLSEGKTVVMTYNTRLAQDWGIISGKKYFSNNLHFNNQKIYYNADNVDNSVFKINKKLLNDILPLGNLFKLPVMEIKNITGANNLAVWEQDDLPALVKLKKNKGEIIYFSGILAFTGLDFLKYLVSFIKCLDDRSYPCIPRKKKCCLTLFYDYESSYGNPRGGAYAEKGMDFILKAHKRHNIKATFNVVGKIFETNPQIIKNIIDNGHEIASHTYEHIVPSRSTPAVIKDSIEKNLRVCAKNFPCQIKGFRSPESQWSPELISLLEQYKFHWNAEDEAGTFPYNLVLNRKLSLMRMPITCDDFPYISEKCSAELMFDRFKKAVEKGMREGTFIAIGFHPWIEGMRSENLNALEQFLDYVSTNSDLCVMTFGEVFDWWKSRCGSAGGTKKEIR